MYTAAPTRYALHLDPDLENLDFAARLAVDLKPTPQPGAASITTVVLDARDLAIESVHLVLDGTRAPVAFRQEPATLHIDLGRAVGEPFLLEIAYRGEINDKMAGFYRSRYTHGGEERYVAVTQFEEHDARRAFPCVDHPAYKAVFEVEIVSEAGHTAIANTPEISPPTPVAGAGGSSGGSSAGSSAARVLHRFEATPPMSTYLVFFGVGAFECLEDDSWRVPIRVAVSPGKAKYAAPALEYCRTSLAFLDEYTGIPYPLGKMDLVGVSDFAYGAMENFGAITFRENYVLSYPESTTRRDVERMMGISAHEVAHMWFGDLVSPAEWKYVWLNEAFATYFGNIVVDHYYPQWRTMDQMMLGSTGAAMDRDALPHTIPIEFPEANPVDIDASTAPIIYAKGASILAMVRGFYGEEAFRNATGSFLATYAYACADTDGFLTAFSGGLGRGGDRGRGGEARRMLTSWIRVRGFPVVTVTREDGAVVLRQRRFSVGTDPENSADAASDDGADWLIPVTGLRDTDEPDSDGSFRLLLQGPLARASFDGDWLKLNAGGQGYYRVFYEDPADWDRLGAAAADGRLGTRDRYGLVSDLDAFVQAGMVGLERYLDYLEAYCRDETAYLVLAAIAGSLSGYHELHGGDPRIAACGRSILGRLAPALAGEPDDEEPYDQVLLRDSVLFALAQFGDEPVRQVCRERMHAIMKGKPVHPDLVPVTLRCAAAADDGTVVEWIRAELEAEGTTESRKAHLLAGLGSLGDASLAGEALEYVIASVPYRNRLFFLRAASSNPAFRSSLWPWLTAHFDELSGIHPYHLGGTIALVVPFGGLGREPEVRRFLDEYRDSGPPVSPGVLDLALDRLELNRRLLGR